MKYIFYDSDETGFEDYDINGEHFKTLIELCKTYCKFFSLYIYFDDKISEKIMEKFEISNEGFADYNNYYINDNKANSYIPIGKKHYYLLNKESIELLFSISDSVFGFLSSHKTDKYKPEDLTFYRSDKSEFFSSETHEGECSLFPIDTEDVSAIISVGRWCCYYDNNATRYTSPPDFIIQSE